MVSRTKVTYTAFFASLVLVSFQHVSRSAETYYVLPTPSAPCPEEGVPCFTLSQYAAKPSDYFASRATIILLPGNHTLDSQLTIRNIKSLKFEAKRSLFTFHAFPQTIVTCSVNARLKFEKVGRVQVNGITFVGCMNNNVISVDQFYVEDCSFDGQGCNGTGLVLREVDNAGIVSSSFSSNTGTGIYDPHYDDYTRGGGAMVVTSCRNVNIFACLYTNNSVAATNGEGGVVWAWNSTLTATNTNFTNNFVRGDGGAGGVVAAENSTITATYSIFTNNSVSGDDGWGGVVFADRSTIITATNSIFNNNFVSGDYGWGGVVAAARSTVTATNTTFTNNFVTRGDDGQGGVVAAYSSTVTATNSIYNNNSVSGDYGWGGVVAAASSTVTATNTTFTNNLVRGEDGRGGALHLFNTTMIAMTATSFQYNVAPTGTVYALGSSVLFSGSTTISNNYGSLCVYSSNITFTGTTDIMNNSIANSTPSRMSDSEEAGAVTGFQSNLFFNDKVNIEYNTGRDGGGISATESKIYTYGSFTVAQNTALLSGGGIYVYQSELNLMEGSVKIFGNTATEAGGGVHAIGSTTTVRGGSVHFVSNHAKRGGGMSFMLNSKLFVIKKKQEKFNVADCNSAHSQNNCIVLKFTGNIAKHGGAIYVYDDTNSGTCEASSSRAQSAASSECFIQSLTLLQYYSPYYYTNLLNTYFANNTATVTGGTLYGGLLDRCTVSPFAEILFFKYYNLTPNTLSTTSYLLNITNLQPQDFGSTATVSSDAVRVCFCRENHRDCSYQPPPLHVKKGETFTISVVAVDQVNNTVAKSKIHASLLQGGGLGERQAIQQTNTEGGCTELSYNVLSLNVSVKLQLYAQGPCMDSGISTSNLTVHIVPCPIGFKDTDSLRCNCDPFLDGYVSNCSIDNESVQRKDNAWFSYVNDTKHQGYIRHKHCPIDYCKPPARNVSRST